MAKPKKPLLSLEARGTIADTLTFQKRGQLTIARKKPIPTDPKSPAQLAWRQVYKDAVAAWHALTPAEKETWRGVCPGLTAYQCFMSSQLKYLPPILPIDIGLPTALRDGQTSYNYTYICADNPANAAGRIKKVYIWARNPCTSVKIGIFYLVSGNSFSTRSYTTIGPVAAGSEQEFDVDLAVDIGDYIGFYEKDGALERDNSGGSGYWYRLGDDIPCDDVGFVVGLTTHRIIHLHGTGV